MANVPLSTVVNTAAVSITSAAGTDATFKAGDGDTGGGNVAITGGRALVSGNDGNVTLKVNNGATGLGNVILLGLPTSDPAVNGALWNDTGVLKISAGGP